MALALWAALPAHAQGIRVDKLGNGQGEVTSNPGRINCGSTCFDFFTFSTAVTLTATAAPGSRFTGWSRDCSGTGTCTLAVSSAIHVVEATFELESTNYTGLWWNPAESGWGLGVSHQGNTTFGTLFTYDAAGAPMWLVMSAGIRLSTADEFTGDLYRTTGPVFNANPFTPIGPQNLTRVGSMRLAFTSAGNGILEYDVNGARVVKAIQKQVFGARAANCVPATGSRASATNYQDLWWNSAESGWGLSLTHQGDIIFGVLFTYAADGRGLWLVMSGGTRQADGSYLGDLYQVTGPAFNANPFTPIGPQNLTRVGSMRLRFSTGEAGTLEYNVGNATVTKAITRQVFGSPLPTCS